MRRRLIALLAAATIAAFVSLAKATPTVTLYLTTVNATRTSGTWQVYAADSDDNDGLANWNLDVIGSNGAVVNTAATIKAPRPSDSSSQYADGLGGTMGFNTSVTTGSNSGTGRVGITAGQDTTYGSTDDPTFDMGVLVGVGQEAPTASPQNGSQGPVDGSGTSTGNTINATTPWKYVPPGTQAAGGNGAGGAPIITYLIGGTLIEQGTYTATAVPGGTQGILTVQPHPGGFVEVLGTADNGMNETWGLPNYQQGNTPIANINPGVIQGGGTIDLGGVLPEPASIGLIAVIGIGLLRAGRTLRRTASHAAPDVHPGLRQANARFAQNS